MKKFFVFIIIFVLSVSGFFYCFFAAITDNYSVKPDNQDHSIQNLLFSISALATFFLSLFSGFRLILSLKKS